MVSGSFVHRDGFAGQGGFIDSGRAFQDHTVHRDVFARPDHKNVAGLHFLNTDLRLLPIPQQHRCFGSEFHEALERVRRAAFGHCFEHFPDGDERGDHGGISSMLSAPRVMSPHIS